jgi:hypothetical protein
MKPVTPVSAMVLVLAMAAPVLGYADDGKLYGGVTNGIWAIRLPGTAGQTGSPSSESSLFDRDAERYTPSQLYGGVRLNQTFAVEGSQTAFGAMPGDPARRTTGATVRPGQVPGSLSVAGVGSVPLDDTTSMTGKLGVHYWQPDTSALSIDGGRLANPGIVYGVGVKRQISKDVHLQAQTEHYRSSAEAGNTPNVTAVMLGVNVGF